MSALFLGTACLSFCVAVSSPPQPAAEPAKSVPATPVEPPPAPPPERKPDRPLSLSSRTLTGEWGGVRSRLADQGVTFSLFFNSQFQAVVHGGRGTGGGRHAASLDMFITADLEKLELVPQADVLLHLQSNFSRGLNPQTGALLEVNDDADGDKKTHVAQLWYRQHFLKRKLSLTLGFLDYQTLVDRNAFANSEDKQFWHQALDNNPLVPLNIGLGAVLAWQPASWYTLQAGIGDAQSVLYKPGFSTAFHDEDWFFAYAEQAIALKIPSKRGPLAGTYRLGMIYDPRPKARFPRDRLTPPTDNSDYGLFISLDQVLWRESPRDDQGLGAFARFGYRTPEANRLARFWSAGVQYKGLIPGRDADTLAFGFAQTDLSPMLRDQALPLADRELVYELYYAWQVTPWVVISPDVQYIANTGGTDDGNDTIVTGVRMRVSF
ncbi:MAG: carbohydrate porin [Planctomycetes bacterium]|nr:carbohydrate porin [Planctomycetota bacterium]